MAVRFDNRWQCLLVFLSIAGYVIQPILADNDIAGHGDIAEAFHAEKPLPRPNLYQERIVGGEIARPGAWPWMVIIFNAGQRLCGGTLIDAKHILSAAHCFHEPNLTDIVVHLGDHDTTTNDEVRHVERRVNEIVLPPLGYDNVTIVDDIAILTMEMAVTFTKTIRPVRLPSGSQLYVGATGVVIGWGDIIEDRINSAVLRQTTTTILSNSECESKFGDGTEITDTLLCDASPVGKSFCSGDSGGPLMVNERGQWIQIGIVSWSYECGSSELPNVYTRVSKYVPWIRQNLK